MVRLKLNGGSTIHGINGATVTLGHDYPLLGAAWKTAIANQCSYCLATRRVARRESQSPSWRTHPWKSFRAHWTVEPKMHVARSLPSNGERPWWAKIESKAPPTRQRAQSKRASAS